MNVKRLKDLREEKDLRQIDISNYLGMSQRNYSYYERGVAALTEEVLNKLDSSNSKNIVNFAKYNHLLFFSAKYLELTEKEKKNFTIEMLFNLFETDFKDKIINKEINKHLNVYDYCYAVLNK